MYKFHVFLTFSLGREEWSSSCSDHFNGRKRLFDAHYMVGQVETKSCPCQDLNLGQHVPSGTNDWAAPAHKSLLKVINK
jgi:hypothetical protein